LLAGYAKPCQHTSDPDTNPHVGMIPITSVDKAMFMGAPWPTITDMIKLL
jgi:hypothetical protein